MEAQATFKAEVFVVPLGISADEVQEQVNSIENKPSQCSVASEMDNLQDIMQEAVYSTRKFTLIDQIKIEAECYQDARQDGATETQLKVSVFPDECPFNLEVVLRVDYLADEE
jgi:chromosome partitioning protein